MENNDDRRIGRYIEAAEKLRRGDYDIDVASEPGDEIGRLGQALQRLAQTLAVRRSEIDRLDEITALINAGLLLDDILEAIYANFRHLLPYDRIGLALLDNNGSGRLRAHWAKSNSPVVRLGKGYEAPMAGSSLEKIIATKKPRILNDLVAYLSRKPQSESTRLVVEEGMRSSLTCPLITTGKPVGFLFFSSSAAGTYADVHVRTYQRIARKLSVILEKGRLVSVLAEQKAAIERQNEELKKLDEMKNALLGMAAHDLRNPIGNLHSIASLLLEPGIELPEAERLDFLNDAKQQTRHMLTLLNDLLDVSLIESGKLTLDKVAVDLRDFLTASVKAHSTIAGAKNIRFRVEPVPPGQAAVDPPRLRQVMDNLLSNAVKFSEPGTTVAVRARRLPEAWRVEVQDQGPGITPEDRARLFKNFARLSAQPTAGEESTGLGLAITRRIVTAHGGEIDADSPPAGGSVFWFTIPASNP